MWGLLQTTATCQRRKQRGQQLKEEGTHRGKYCRRPTESGKSLQTENYKSKNWIPWWIKLLMTKSCPPVTTDSEFLRCYYQTRCSEGMWQDSSRSSGLSYVQSGGNKFKKKKGRGKWTEKGGLRRSLYLTPCRASRSPESFAFRSCSSCSCLLSTWSSCCASTLMSLATTTAVWRSAWKRRQSSFSSWKCKRADQNRTGLHIQAYL